MEKRKLTIMYLLITSSYALYAANSDWAPVYDKLSPWIGRLATFLIFVGAINLGEAYANEEAAAKLRGTKKIIAGILTMVLWNIVKNLFPF